MFCGHAIHLECWGNYYTSVHQQHLSRNYFEGQMAIDVTKREFLCPLCKSISNILVPYTPVVKSEEGAETMGVDSASGSSCVDDMLEWVGVGGGSCADEEGSAAAVAAGATKDGQAPTLSPAFVRMLELLTDISTKHYSGTSKYSRQQQALCLWRAAAASVVVASLGSMPASTDSAGDSKEATGMQTGSMDDDGAACVPMNRSASAWIGMERGLEQLQPLLQAAMHPAIVSAANSCLPDQLSRQSRASIHIALAFVVVQCSDVDFVCEYWGKCPFLYTIVYVLWWYSVLIKLLDRVRHLVHYYSHCYYNVVQQVCRYDQ
jgi:hypothetical protein